MNEVKFEDYIKNFEKIFYNKTYQRWRITKDKSAKDVVGEYYEEFRRDFYKNLGFIISPDNKKVFGSTYNADMALVMELNGVIKVVEESKGHYIDSCFLKRAMMNFADVINTCIKSNVEVPYFILSCPTKMNNYDKIFNNSLEVFREDIQEKMIEKFKYFPLCKNGRIDKKLYFKTDQNCFLLDSTLIKNEIEFFHSIK